MFYENFKSIFDMKETLGGYYLTQDVDFNEVSEFFTAVSIYELLVDCKETRILIEKWI